MLRIGEHERFAELQPAGAGAQVRREEHGLAGGHERAVARVVAPYRLPTFVYAIPRPEVNRTITVSSPSSRPRCS